MVDRYDKINLVPFGEFVPNVFWWVNRVTKEAGDFAPGSRIVEFPVNGHKVGVFICYESAFPDLVREFARGGAEVLVNLSNDGYFGRSAAREQHLDLVRMRAAENRRWILRATNDGITVTVDPAGRIVLSRAAVSGNCGRRDLSVSVGCHALHEIRRLVRVGMPDRRGVPGRVAGNAPAWCTWYYTSVKGRSKARPRTASSVRQSVTIPSRLAIEVERVARKKHLTMSRALVMLAERGVEAEAAARESLNAAYRRFMAEDDPGRKGEAGKDLVRAIFGKDAIAEDSIL